MPDEVPIVTSCPLCLDADEVQSMITIEIERAFPKGRTEILICRKCALAVVEAVGKVEPPLLSTLIYDTTPREEAVEALEEPLLDPIKAKAAWDAGVQHAAEATEYATGIKRLDEGDETQAESAELHDGEDSDDGTSTD